MTETLSRLHEVLEGAVEDDRAEGIIRAKREIFTDPEIFELEMKHIFEGNWVYLPTTRRSPTWATTSPRTSAVSPS